MKRRQMVGKEDGWEEGKEDGWEGGKEDGREGGRKELYIDLYTTIWYIISKAVSGFLIFIYTEWIFYIYIYKFNCREA
jgi:hypothetical protein